MSSVPTQRRHTVAPHGDRHVRIEVELRIGGRHRGVEARRRAAPGEGRIQPGRVFDRVVDLDGVPDGYRAMQARESIKVMIAP